MGAGKRTAPLAQSSPARDGTLSCVSANVHRDSGTIMAASRSSCKPTEFLRDLRTAAVDTLRGLTLTVGQTLDFESTSPCMPIRRCSTASSRVWIRRSCLDWAFQLPTFWLATMLLRLNRGRWFCWKQASRRLACCGGAKQVRCQAAKATRVSAGKSRARIGKRWPADSSH